MASLSPSKTRFPREYNFQQMSNLVDNFVNDDFPSEDPASFWNNLFASTNTQQLYAKCLIYKYIAYIYGLGNKPLKEVEQTIKKIICHPSPSSKSVESNKPNSEASPHHKRGRTSTSAGRRWTSTDTRVAVTGKRDSIAPADISGGQHNRVKRKSSDNILEETSLSLPNSNAEYDGNTVVKLRKLIYSISFLVHTCNLYKWDFNSLREVFLVWNKARSWHHTAIAFEQAIMKRISKPPDFYPVPEKKWGQSLTDVIYGCHSADTNETETFITLNHKLTGNSIKYPTLRYKVEKEEDSILSLIEATRVLIEKMYNRNEETKLLSLLHIFCEALIMAPYVPVSLLQSAYVSIQALLLMPLPVCASAKEVLDLIQVEMKSPGYFRRTIFFQEQEIYNFSQQSINTTSSGTPTNVFIDKGSSDWDTVETAFRNLSAKFDDTLMSECYRQRLVIEHIFHSVFGPESCDLPRLRKTLEDSSDSHVARLYTEGLSIMDHSVTMENPTHAQEFIRQQLEALSNLLTVEEQEVSHTKENLPAIKEGSQPPSKSTSRKLSGLSGLISPLRIQSHLSRSASSLTSPSSSKSGLSPPIQEQPKKPSSADKMNYSQVILKSFDKNKLSDAIFELVRLTAREYVAEKRRSSSVYSSAQKRYLDRKRSSLLGSEDIRDSGLIEDYAEDDKVPPSPRFLKHLAEEYSRWETDLRPFISLREGKSGNVNHYLAVAGIFCDKASDHTNKSPAKSPMRSPRKSSMMSAGKSPRKSREMRSGDFWKKFSEKGFSESKAKDDENLDKLANSFRYSGLLTDDEKKELENAKRRLGNSLSPRDSSLRRSKSSNAELPASKNALKPPIESNGISSTSSSPDKTSKTPSRKTKQRFLTLGRKGISIMRKIRRSSSEPIENLRNAATMDLQNQVETFTESKNKPDEVEMLPKTKTISVSSTPASSNVTFDATRVARCRTSSLPLRNSMREKKKGKHRRETASHTSYSPTFNFNNVSVVITKKSRVRIRRYSSSPKDYSSSQTVAKAFSFDALDCVNEVDPLSRSHSNSTLIPNRTLSVEERHVFADDDESRIRIDSGITAGDKNHDDSSLASPESCRDENWEETGVAGVKFVRQKVLRRNRKSRSSLTQQIQERVSRKKILKLAFVGNDRTVGDMARAYYELRRRQLTRGPLKNHIDLRFYYIPVGDSTFADEYGSKQSGCAPFDLEISEILGEVDPWYQSVVTMCANNLLRVLPAVSSESDEESSPVFSETSSLKAIPTPDNILANSMLSYFRFAIKTSYVPIFKAVLRTSSDEMITEVFCCRAEIGHVAYKQAIAAGRFGKLGKLVDLSNDTGPPPAYTQFKYKKYGINGNFVLSKTLDEAEYYRVCFIPIALSGNNQDQARFPGADGLQVTLIENEKRLKHIKRGSKTPLQEDESTSTKFSVSEAKMEVIRPVQGTFTICLDHNLIHTNIKSFEVSRCLAPEHERPNSRKRKQLINTAHVMSLPIKTFCPNSNLA